MSESKKVLVVDDSAVTAEQLKQVIGELPGYEVVGHASDGAGAIKLYQELKPDIVCMDIIMPLMDGLAATRSLIRMDKDATVVMISSVGGDRNKALEALKIGAKSVIAKPFDAKEVRSVLSAL